MFINIKYASLICFNVSFNKKTLEKHTHKNKKKVRLGVYKYLHENCEWNITYV